MKPMAILHMVGVLVLGGSLTLHAEGLPKQGKYRGLFGARAAGTTHELEKDHVFFVGGFSGVFFNERNEGFLDKTSVECPGVADIVNGLDIAGHGFCIVSDKTGDKAFLAWKARETSLGVGKGEFQWTGGTGKYAGISGNNTFSFVSIGNTPASAVIWEGEWRLP